MRKALLAFVLLLAASPIFAQLNQAPVPLLPGSYTVATLPVLGAQPRLALITDGNGQSCTTGGGATNVLCLWSAATSTWGPAGAAANGAVIPVANLPGATFDVQLGNCQTLIAGAIGITCDATGYTTTQSCAAQITWTTSNATILWPHVEVDNNVAAGICFLANSNTLTNLQIIGIGNQSLIKLTGASQTGIQIKTAGTFTAVPLGVDARMDDQPPAVYVTPANFTTLGATVGGTHGNLKISNQNSDANVEIGRVESLQNIQPGLIAGTVTVVQGANPTFTRNGGGSFITDGYIVGNWFLATGFTNASNNGWWHIKTIVAATITADAAAAATTNNNAVNETSGSGVVTFSSTGVFLEGPLYDTFNVLAGGQVQAIALGTNVKVQGLKFDGQNQTSSSCLRFDDMAYGYIQDVDAINCNTATYELGGGGYRNSVQHTHVFGGEVTSPFIVFVAQTELNANDLSVEGFEGTNNPASDFMLQFHQTHGSNVTNCVVNGAGYSGRGFKLYRSNHNSFTNCTVTRVGTSAGTNNGVKLERTSGFNTFVNFKVINNFGNGWLFSEDSGHNRVIGGTTQGNQADQFSSIIDTSRNANPTGLTVTSTKTGTCPGATTCTFQVVRTAGNWCGGASGDANQQYDGTGVQGIGIATGEGAIAQFTGFATAANNHPNNEFRIISCLTTTNPGDTLVLFDPNNVHVAEAGRAGVAAVEIYPDNANEIIGVDCGNDRNTGGNAITVDGNDWKIDDVNCSDDNGLATAGVNWYGTTSGSGASNALNLNSTNLYFNQRTVVTNSSFVGYPSGKDVFLTTANALPSNAKITNNHLADGVTNLATISTNFFCNNTGASMNFCNTVGNISLPANSGTNVAGTLLSISGGSGTGNAIPDPFCINGGESDLASGAGVQAELCRVKFNKVLALTTGAASTVASIPLPTLAMTGGWVAYHLEATDGTNQCTLDGNIHFSGENSAGVFVVAPTAATGNNQSNSCTATKTLTATWTLTGANPALLQITPTLTGITATRFTGVFEPHFMGNTNPTL